MCSKLPARGRERLCFYDQRRVFIYSEILEASPVSPVGAHFKVFKVLTCLATEHDLRLVVVAGLVCFGGCFTAFRLYSRMRTASGHGVRAAWVLLTGLVAGCSVWATHFIAMLSYQTGLRSGFLPLGTLASLLIAGVFMAAAFAAPAFAAGRAGRIAGGVLAGLGVGAMHYTGMGAYVTEGVLTWDLSIMAGSVVVGVGVALAAMFAARDASRRFDSRYSLLHEGVHPPVRLHQAWLHLVAELRESECRLVERVIHRVSVALNRVASEHGVGVVRVERDSERPTAIHAQRSVGGDGNNRPGGDGNNRPVGGEGNNRREIERGFHES